MPRFALYVLFAIISVLPLLNCPVLPYSGDKDATPVPGATGTSTPTPTPVTGPTPQAVLVERFGTDQEDAGCAISVGDKIAVVGNIGSDTESNMVLLVYDLVDPFSSSSWVKVLDGEQGDSANGVVCRGGIIAVTGSVTGPADLNGDGIANNATGEDPTNYGQSDIFLSVFGSDETFKWSKRLGGISGDAGKGITLLGTDISLTHVVVTGYVFGDADLDGNGIMESPGAADMDIFISVFTIDGGFVLSKRFGGQAEDTGNGITCYGENYDSFVITGFVTGQADLNDNGFIENLGGEMLESWHSNRDIFIAAFTANGSSLFTSRLGGAGVDWGQSIAFNRTRFAVTGRIEGSADLNGIKSDGAESSAIGGADIFISVFDSGTLTWSKRLGGNQTDDGLGISITGAGDVVLCGGVTGDADLNVNTADGKESFGSGSVDGFVTAFSFIGDYIFSGRFGGSGSDYCSGVFAETGNKIYMTGSVYESADLNGDRDDEDENESMGTFGLSDIFVSVLKW